MTTRTEPESIVDPDVLLDKQQHITMALARLRNYRETGEDTRSQESALNRLIDEWKTEAGV